MGIIRSITGWRDRRLIRSYLGIEPLHTVFDEHWVSAESGQRLYSHLHYPAEGRGPWPGLIFVPGGGSAGIDYDGSTELTADDAASVGFAVMHYDPSGRGRTGGVEDHWGPSHQAELRDVVSYASGLAQVQGDFIGVFSFSIGITIASGALAGFEMPGVRFLYDWEGPSNRHITTKNDTHPPLRAFPTSDGGFWDEREAVAFMGRVPCGYFRYQAVRDHVQGARKDHAMELVNLATQGRAAWTRCNGNPEGTVMDPSRLDSYEWVPERENHKGRLLKYLLEVRDRCTR